MSDDTRTTRTEKGISLARGPALILGTILLAAGLYFIYKQHMFPKFAQFPNGKVPAKGKVFFGIFGANGWTGMLTAVGGGLLLFGAAQHLLAKTMSLIGDRAGRRGDQDNGRTSLDERRIGARPVSPSTAWHRPGLIGRQPPHHRRENADEHKRV
jgi:hypothetical protein